MEHINNRHNKKGSRKQQRLRQKRIQLFVRKVLPVLIAGILLISIVSIIMSSQNAEEEPIIATVGTIATEENMSRLVETVDTVETLYESEPTTEVIEEVDPTQVQFIESYQWSNMVYTTTRVHLRTQPTKESYSLRILPQGQVVVAYAQDKTDDWYYVSWDAEDGGCGWIKSESLREYRHDYVDIPIDYYQQDLVRDTIDYFGLDIDEYFIYGMMYVESRFDNSEESSAGAHGIMQIIPSTWKTMYSQLCTDYPDIAQTIVNDDSDINSNIVLGIYTIKVIQDGWGVESTKENSSRILTSYNRGTANARSYYNTYGTYSSSYSKNVLRAAEYIRTYNTWKEGI